MAISNISWNELSEKIPDIVERVKIGGKVVLKLVTSKIKQKMPEIKEYLKHNEKNLGSKEQLLLSSEVKKYLVLEEINFDEKNKLIKKYLKQDYWSIYLLGRKAQIEKQNYNLEGVRKIKNEASQMSGYAGSRLVNFILQGYFEEIFIPLLKHQISVLKTDSEIFSWFNSFVNNQITFFPRAIWVMNETTEEEIKREMYKRCITNDYKKVNLHTIGPTNNKKIQNVFMILSKDGVFPKFNFDPVEDLPESGLYTFRLTIQ